MWTHTLSSILIRTSIEQKKQKKSRKEEEEGWGFPAACQGLDFPGQRQIFGIAHIFCSHPCSFPFSDPERCEEWISNISRIQSNGKPWLPSKHSRVCSDHFLLSDFKTETKIRELTNSAVPTVFLSDLNHKQPKNSGLQSFPKIHYLKPSQTKSEAVETQGDANDKKYTKHVEHEQFNGTHHPSFPKKRCAGHSHSTPKTVEFGTSKTIETESDEIAGKFMRLTEHSYTIPDIERELEDKKRALEEMGEKLAEKNKEIKILNQKLKRRDLRISKLCSDMEEQKQKLSLEKHELLTSSFDNKALMLIENELSTTQIESTNGMRYSDELKKFAISLNNYSSQAYNFVRQYLSLPHPSTLQKWAAARSGNPDCVIELSKTFDKQDGMEEKAEILNAMFDEIDEEKACT
ncbi:THAP domain protein [Plakobranchus ocellatus]|uniref:THAP domain protein n=1 Tax=Plakobranchus ocellatus TaxID=259542 RepID=A0AAV3YQS4_9GAST|nr:THAP domain protein [Plakobranchus ocellatus]